MTVCDCSTHFNNQVSYATKNNYCKLCSIRFFNFTESFININSKALSNLKDLSSTPIGRHKNIYTSAVKELLNYNERTKNILSNKFNYFSDEWYRSKKFPIMKYYYRDENFKAFYDELLEKENKKSITTLSFDQLKDFYDFQLNRNTIRYDIGEQQLQIDAEFIEYYEKTYNTKIPCNFPREKERNKMNLQDYLETHDYDVEDYNLLNDFTVFSCNYSETKAILLNYFDLNYCKSCVSQYWYEECIGEMLYINSSIITLIFENLGKGAGFLVLHSENFIKLRKTIADKLHEIKSWKNEIFCYKWRGSSRYNELLQILPSILRNCDIPESHYRYRKQIYFDDVICGHPMASNGWCREAMDAILECYE